MTAPRTILITGASSGFGQLAASLLVARGHHVVAALRGGAARLAAVYSAEEVASGRLTALDLHLERPATFAAARALVEEKFGGRLDVLLNNAGYGLLGPAEDQSEEKLRHQLEVNFFGPALLTNLLLPALRAARGRILNVSSVAGFVSFPFYAVYSASKFALEGYSEGLAFELRPFGVQVGIVEPGGFRTGFSPTAAQATALVPTGSQYEAQSRAINHFLAERVAKLVADPMIVARKLVKLCLRRRVPLRTVIGKDARAMAFLRWLVPERVRVWLIDRGFRKLFFAEP